MCALIRYCIFGTEKAPFENVRYHLALLFICRLILLHSNEWPDVIRESIVQYSSLPVWHNYPCAYPTEFYLLRGLFVFN